MTLHYLISFDNAQFMGRCVEEWPNWFGKFTILVKKNLSYVSYRPKNENTAKSKIIHSFFVTEGRGLKHGNSTGKFFVKTSGVVMFLL